ncbi:MAG: hypothetical protein HY719_03340 [Planctomycetes bacterium]|nr:hypothetical protein [Planctomycetota bacterium]
MCRIFVLRLTLVSLIVFFAAMATGGCKAVPDDKESEKPSGVNAHPKPTNPFPPFPILPNSKEAKTPQAVLSTLPNETVLFYSTTGRGGGQFDIGPVKLTVKGEVYDVLLDWAKFKTKALTVKVTEPVVKLKSDSEETVMDAKSDSEKTTDQVAVYFIGVGLRVRAQFTASEENVRVSGLYDLAVAGEKQQITGTLMIQTIGITGDTVTSLIPMPSGINLSTIQSALNCIATLKARLYTDTTIVIEPQTFAVGCRFRLDNAILPFADRLESHAQITPGGAALPTSDPGATQEGTAPKTSK